MKLLKWKFNGILFFEDNGMIDEEIESLKDNPEKEQCLTCKWWRDESIIDIKGNMCWMSPGGTWSMKQHWGLCNLYPNSVWKQDSSFCGQYKERKQ